MRESFETSALLTEHRPPFLSLSLIKTVSSCVVQIVCVITNQGSGNPNCFEISEHVCATGCNKKNADLRILFPSKTRHFLIMCAFEMNKVHFENLFGLINIAQWPAKCHYEGRKKKIENGKEPSKLEKKFQ